MNISTHRVLTNQDAIIFSRVSSTQEKKDTIYSSHLFSLSGDLDYSHNINSSLDLISPYGEISVSHRILMRRIIQCFRIFKDGTISRFFNDVFEQMVDLADDPDTSAFARIKNMPMPSYSMRDEGKFWANGQLIQRISPYQPREECDVPGFFLETYEWGDEFFDARIEFAPFLGAHLLLPRSPVIKIEYSPALKKTLEFIQEKVALWQKTTILLGEWT